MIFGLIENITFILFIWKVIDDLAPDYSNIYDMKIEILSLSSLLSSTAWLSEWFLLIFTLNDNYDHRTLRDNFNLL